MIDLCRPFGHGAEHGAVIQFLHRIAAQKAAFDLAHKQDHGRGILLGDMNAGRGVGGAWGARDKTNAGPAGGLAIGLGHHGRAAFIAADRDRDAAIDQGIEHRQIGFAGNAESLCHFLSDQLIDQNLGRCAGDEFGVKRHGKITFSVKARSFSEGACGPL